MFTVVVAGIGLPWILNVDEAEESVTCTDKLTGLPYVLSICICLIKHLTPDGEVRTEVVPVLDKFIPAFLY